MNSSEQDTNTRRRGSRERDFRRLPPRLSPEQWTTTQDVTVVPEPTYRFAFNQDVAIVLQYAAAGLV